VGRWLNIAGLLLLVSSCASGTEPASLGLRVQALGGGLPADVASIRVTYRIGDEPALTREATLDELEQGAGTRRLTLDALPSHTDITLTIQGIDRAGQVAHVGSAGPLLLGENERLRLKVVLYARARSEAIPGAAPPPRFMHTATLLDDGRLLIAGGFGEPQAVECPANAPARSACFHMHALDDAWLFDPTSAQFSEVAGGMLEARGGHSATRLPAGRILVAGGASSATLVLAAHDQGFEPSWLGIDSAGAPATLATFELFDGWASAHDALREPARGRFVGPQGTPLAPGALERPRFLHGAAVSLANPARVVLAGGNEPLSAQSCEVFDAERKGGLGVLPGLSALPSARRTPAAVSLRDGDASFVWIFGGRSASTNAELADRWFWGTHDGAGTLVEASESAFPNARGSDDTAQPGYAFVQPLALALGAQTHAFVTGGVGPRCDAAGEPQFGHAATGGRPCASEKALNRGFLTDASSGSTTPVQLTSAHVLGSASALPDGTGVLTGGFASLTLDAHAVVHVLSLPAPLAQHERSLHSARALHTSTAFGQAGLLTVGGVVFRGGTLELVAGAEVLWL
jgi:hypothetical protein